MPRFTRSPLCRFERDAPRDDFLSVHSTISRCNEVVDEGARRDHVVGRDDADRHDLGRFRDDRRACHGHDRIEVARGQRVAQIAEVVRAVCTDQREVGRDRQRDEECAAVDDDFLRAFRDERSDTRRGQHAAESESRGPDPLGERSLRHELDGDLAGDHLPLRFRIGADVRDDQPAHELGVDQAADADARARRVVGDDGEVACDAWRTSSAIIRWGDPTPMKPPIISDEPSAIFSTAADSAIPLCMRPAPRSTCETR